MKRHVEFNASGTLVGRNWYNQECVKEFDETFQTTQMPWSTEAHNVEEILQYVTNDGDFQSCKVVLANFYLSAKTTYQRKSRTIQVIKPLFIPFNKEQYKDYFCEFAPDWYYERMEAC